MQANSALLDKRRQVIGVGAAGHLHVDAGIGGFGGRVFVIGGQAVHGQLTDGIPVTDDETVVFPFVPKNLPQEQFIRAGGDPVQIAEGCHERRHAGVERRLEGREVDVAQFDLGDVGGVVVPPALAGAVAREMLGTGGDVAGF